MLRGKVVGREGVEPSTKRLRVAWLSTIYTLKTWVDPLRRLWDRRWFKPSSKASLRSVTDSIDSPQP